LVLNGKSRFLELYTEVRQEFAKGNFQFGSVNQFLGELDQP
jgi:hypothetical protein